MKTVFLSGWGFDAEVGQRLSVVKQLVSLPQCGLDSMYEQMTPHRNILIAWSLGGQWAIRFALDHPQAVAGLVLIASTPCFCQKEGWKSACSEAWFHDFQDRLAQAPHASLRRFSQLMLQGESLKRDQRQAILENMQQHFILEKPELLQGLQMLHKHDLREQLRELKMPVLLIHGEQDRIIPFAASTWMAQALCNSRLYRIQHCGHAPLWTHTDLLNQVVENWCQQII